MKSLVGKTKVRGDSVRDTIVPLVSGMRSNGLAIFVHLTENNILQGVG